MIASPHARASGTSIVAICWLASMLVLQVSDAQANQCPVLRELPATRPDCTPSPPMVPVDGGWHEVTGEVVMEVTVDPTGVLVSSKIVGDGLGNRIHDRIAHSAAAGACWGIHRVDGEATCYTVTVPITFAPPDPSSD